MIIESVKARQIYDSRGNPTVEVDVQTAAGLFRASVPSGVCSSEINEALEVRDNKSDFQGKGVKAALRAVHKYLKPELVGKELLSMEVQQAVDKAMIAIDGSGDKSKRGVNSMAPVSMAVCRAGAADRSLPLYGHIADIMDTKEMNLPIPVFNFLNGGIHAQNALTMQEFLVIPSGAESFSEAMRVGVEAYHRLESLIKERFGPGATTVGDDGAFSLRLKTTEEALGLLQEVIHESGHQAKVTLGIDVAATDFYLNNVYDLSFKERSQLHQESVVRTTDQLLEYYKGLVRRYPISFLEDPFDFEDYSGFARLTAAVGGDVTVVGDDLTVTSVKRINVAVKKEACNGVLVKLNQIGTLTELMKACQLAHSKAWAVVVSHRSGDTEDPFIADLAVGLRAEYIKAGAPCRSERVCKYNQLLRIEEELGLTATYGRIKPTVESEV